MEGNFYVSEASVKCETKGQIARAFANCQTESEAYGKCVQDAHMNKILVKDSCLEERLILRKCVDAAAKSNREAALLAASKRETTKTKESE